MVKSDEVWAATTSQFLDVKLGDFGNQKMGQFEKIHMSPSDIILPSDILGHNLVTGSASKSELTQFLNFCLLIEAFILNEHIMIRTPVEMNELMMAVVETGLFTRFLEVPVNSLDDIIKIIVVAPEARRFDPDTAFEEVEGRLGDMTRFDKDTLKKLAGHIIHEIMAARLGCSYASDFDDAGLEYNKTIAERIQTLDRLTPARFYSILKTSLKSEVEDLRTSGWSCDLYIPPLALIVLKKCVGNRKLIGEIMLEERRRAARFRSWVEELRSDFLNARTIQEARRAQTKIEKMFKEFTGPEDPESWKATSWCGLLAAFPKSVWDGLSKDDIDLKSLISFFTARPLQKVIQLIRQRNYIYLLQVRDKVSRINDYAELTEKVFGVSLSAHDIGIIRNMN